MPSIELKLSTKSKYYFQKIANYRTLSFRPIGPFQLSLSGDSLPIHYIVDYILLKQYIFVITMMICFLYTC